MKTKKTRSDLIALPALLLSSAIFLGVQCNGMDSVRDYLDRIESEKGVDVARFEAQNIIYDTNFTMFGMRSAANTYLNRN